MNRNIIQVVLSNTNNKKLFQITHLKKISHKYDYLLSKIITFKKYYTSNYIGYTTADSIFLYLIWMNKFIYFNYIHCDDLYKKIISFQNSDIILWYHHNVNIKQQYLIDSYIQLIDTRKIDLSIIIDLHKNKHNCSTNAMNYAARNGHLDIVIWLHENRSEGCTTDAMDWAAMNGHLDIVIWLHENRKEGCSIYAMNWAAKYGHLDIVIWLHENRSEGCTTYAMNLAAENRHLDIVIWLHENRSEGCTTNAMDYAAMYGHIDVIKWLHENRNEGCTTDAMDYAAGNGFLDIVILLHEHKKYTPLLNMYTIKRVIKKLDFDMLKFIFKNEIVIKNINEIDILMYGIESNNLDMCKIICENIILNSSTHKDDFDTIMLEIWKNKNLDIFNYMMSIKSKIVIAN